MLAQTAGDPTVEVEVSMSKPFDIACVILVIWFWLCFVILLRATVVRRASVVSPSLGKIRFL